MKHLYRLAMVMAGLLLSQVVHGQGKETLPAMKRQASVQAVVDEHLDALNQCDWNRVMAQFPNDVELFLPSGQDVIGRPAVGKLFKSVVEPVAKGGICGLKFEKVHSKLVGNTLVVHWRIVGNALIEPYHGTDAYITRDGLMVSQVTTFVGSDLKIKK